MSELIQNLKKVHLSMSHAICARDYLCEACVVGEAIATLESMQADKEAMDMLRDFASKQEPLGAEFSKVLHDNLSELYIADVLPAPPIQQEG